MEKFIRMIPSLAQMYKGGRMHELNTICSTLVRVVVCPSLSWFGPLGLLGPRTGITVYPGGCQEEG